MQNVLIIRRWASQTAGRSQAFWTARNEEVSSRYNFRTYRRFSAAWSFRHFTVSQLKLSVDAINDDHNNGVPLGRTFAFLKCHQCEPHVSEHEPGRLVGNRAADAMTHSLSSEITAASQPFAFRLFSYSAYALILIIQWNRPYDDTSLPLMQHQMKIN